MTQRHNPDQLRERAAQLLLFAKRARKEGDPEFAAQLVRIAGEAYEEASRPPKRSKSE